MASFCSKCGNPIKTGANVCGMCGEAVIMVQNTQTKQVDYSQQPYVQQQQDQQVNYQGGGFVDSDEVTIASIGNGFLQNIISISALKSVGSVLTQKRVYVQGGLVS